MASEERDLMILRVIETGGSEAVEFLKTMLPEATPEDLAAVYGA